MVIFKITKSLVRTVPDHYAFLDVRTFPTLILFFSFLISYTSSYKGSP